MRCNNLLSKLKKITVVVSMGATVTSVSCTTEERISGQAQAGGAVLGGLAGALIAGDKNREGGAVIGALIGGLAGNQVGKKQISNLHVTQAETDRLASKVASANEFNRKVAIYNQDLNKQITAIVQMQDAKRALALAQAKRAEIERNLRAIDQRIESRKETNAPPVQNTIPELTQERRNLQSAADRLRAIERNKGG